MAAITPTTINIGHAIGKQVHTIDPHVSPRHSWTIIQGPHTAPTVAPKHMAITNSPTPSARTSRNNIIIAIAIEILLHLDNSINSSLI